MDVLLKFSSFEALSGFYRQKSGLSMASKICPSMANIFVSIMEKNLIKDLISQDIIISYYRYVNDIYSIVKKGSTEEILNKMNEFDQSLKFTVEYMSDNKLNFLDTTIGLENEDLHLEFYRKSSASNCLTNYKNAVSPKSYKISTLCGEIHRVNNCTSSPTKLKKAFKQLESIFVENEYPRKLIQEKIKEISDRNFGPSSHKLERIEQQKS